jgi:hypothetical protein
VPRIGITGHANLTADSEQLVAAGIRSALENHPGELIGVTCLARGADQVFARIVLELGGSVEVVLPAEDYRGNTVEPGNLADFDELLGKAARVHTMDFTKSGSAAYMAASEYVLDHVDAVVAVWDGLPGRNGGTADVVVAARARALPVTVVWPPGARRER